jgi:hypothetical protein
MNAVSGCAHDAADAIAYLKLAKFQLSEDSVTLELLLSEIREWLEAQLCVHFLLSPGSVMNSIYVSLSDDSATETCILRITMLLRFKPRLLYNFNALLGPGHRLEYSDTVDEVRFFVLVKGNSAQILSTVAADVPSPSTTDELRTIIISQSSWKFLLDRESDRGWLVCLSQLLQVVILHHFFSYSFF